ncbi:exported hypothetical protein [Candidatus Zixiibacteriota bacterium]|nr:exported hypothetical protein [candidate division Zixibacteria bacterium]
MSVRRSILKKSLFLLAMAVAFHTAPAFGGLFYLDPDTTFITSGVGTEFSVDLKVDAGVTGMKLYQVFLHYDKLRLDTVSVTEGPLMQSAGTTVFHAYVEDDSTALRLESVILGYGLVVDGPGTLATIRFRAIGTGLVNMTMDNLVVHDVNNNPISETGRGAVFCINTPPSPFGLAEPSNLQNITIPIIDNFVFRWHKSYTPYQGDQIRYDLMYSTEPSFSAPHVTTVTGLTDTAYSIPASVMSTGDYYWKVRAYSTLNGYETWCDPSPWSFHLTIASYPGSFSLASPIDQSKLSLACINDIPLDWSDPASPIPNDTMTYTLYFGPTANLPSGSVFDTTVKNISQLVIGENRFARTQWIYWRVKATNKIGFDTLSINTRSFMTYMRGDANNTGSLNILDVSYIINNLYKSGPDSVPLEAADVNGNQVTNILDVSYLINFLYKGGSAPYCP